jgi:Putative restriction endonuclease
LAWSREVGIIIRFGKRTSPSTKGEDEGFKKNLYAEIGIAEYWQFDPKGQWIKEKLRGFQLVNGVYEPIVNGHSEALGLRLEVDGKLISFYRLDNGEKLLIPIELYESRQEFQIKARQFQAEARQFQAEARQFQAEAQQLEEQLMSERSTTENLQQQLDRYREQFGAL